MLYDRKLYVFRHRSTMFFAEVDSR